MAVSHWLIGFVLFLLPFVMWVSAQQQGCSVANDRPSVDENNPPGYVVTTIHVEPGFTVTIDPTSPDAGFFTIQGSELQLSRSVDYEEDTLLLVYLTCQNAVELSDSLEIIVTIVNLNDNSPVFKQTNLTEVVPEDTKVNATIVPLEDLSASDGDLDTIFYELTTVVPGTDGYFAIKGVNNPEIYLQKALDYDKFNFTMLVLYARDRAVGSSDITNTATATINIFIEQSDTKPPWFLPCTFIDTDKRICISSPYTGRVNISEMSTEPLKLEPGPIYAIDPDYTLNEKIVYSIVGGNTDNVFSVNADTGNLTMNKAATAPDSYLLQVMATQVNNIQKYSIATVEIKVINKSEYPPYFESRIYYGTVSVGLAPRSFVFQAGDPSSPLMITAMDEDFPDKINPNIEYYIKNSTDFIATKDGLILTNVMLQSPGTVTIEAVAKDTVSLQEGSTVIVVEVVLATAVTISDKRYTAQDMALLGGILAALLLIAFVFLGLMIFKWYGKPVKYLIGKKFSKEVSGDYQNQSYQQEEPPYVNIRQHEMSQDSSVQSMVHVLEQPVHSLPSSHVEEINSLPKASTASTIIFDQEEKGEEVEEETEHEKEVKSILRTDRRVADDGYKAVWFKTDVDPDAGERVEVIEENAADGDDDNDQDVEKNEKEEDDDYDNDSHHRGLGVAAVNGAREGPEAAALELKGEAVMSQDCNDEWELSKENVQPLRQGRVMSTLQEALAQQDTAIHTAVQLKKQEFESEIRFYSGDDPLDVWDRYIKWTEQTFPQGGKESNLSAILERAVKALNEQRRYYQDPRYLNLWLKFGDCCNEPLDLYSYLHSQEIGTNLALLYITWAEVLEARGNFKKADQIFQEGLQRKAEPLDKLQSYHRQFQTRVSRQTLLGLEESSDETDMGLLGAAEPQRSSLADLKGRGKKKVRAPISRVGDALKATNQNRSFQARTSQQLSNNPSFAVFDENSASASGPEIPVLTPQPWAAPPVPRAKENELSAGPWNSGRRPRSSANSGVEVPCPLPNFTPYVEESAQQQVMTPCKIEPSINRVLSARKPEKEEDPLQRVQNHQQDTQEKKELVMYCKDKVYAGVEEFSLEEIRAEVYRKKTKKKTEEEMQALAQKREEIQRRIEELEKKLEKEEDKQQQPLEQPTDRTEASPPLGLQGVTSSSATEVGEKQHLLQSEFQASEDAQLHKPFCSEGVIRSLAVCPDMQRGNVLLDSESERGEQRDEASLGKKDVRLLPPPDPAMSFSVFDESSTLGNQNISCSADHTQKSARRPLAVRKPSESLTAKENIPPEPCDELNGIEPLSEDAIVTGSYKNKTLCANPEDTCDFVRAAHLASTPFHGILAPRVPAPAFSQALLKEDCPEPKAAPLNQETLVCEGAYSEALCVKKLSPIMEASLEDTRSSGSSVSSGSSLSSVTQISTIKYLHIPEKLELAQSLPIETIPDSGGISENITGDDVTQLSWTTEQRKKLFDPMPESLAASPDFHLEACALPAMESEKEVELGNETYCIKWEYWTNDEYKMFFAIPANFPQLDAKGFAIKVYSQPVPWDFYIMLQLQERLNTDFDQSFSENCSCYLYEDGCAVLHRDINRLTLGDVIHGCKSIPEDVILLVVHNLLSVVEKLHRAEIVHGDLSPEVFFLGDRICDPFAKDEMTRALKIVDFSHSLDLRVQSRVDLSHSFPISQTPHGQQLLVKSSLPYQVDLVGIADIVHLMLFGDHIQVCQENSTWKISRNVSKTGDSDFWSKLFGRILNADDNNGKLTDPVPRSFNGQAATCSQKEEGTEFTPEVFLLQKYCRSFFRGCHGEGRRSGESLRGSGGHLQQQRFAGNSTAQNHQGSKRRRQDCPKRLCCRLSACQWIPVAEHSHLTSGDSAMRSRGLLMP
ncbi:mitotic checkpoint serine/threonine-protein kinase BUB1 beta isoform D [Patagioenas fasciata monilis]|uniref:Mitotic checkpoint serine/threonine-protein kinase BUB1 beta isoform D n=1 Tax=Patagioenas fasciata monilis TaxID=372326 RepID=A0A1V4JPS2_PATFA|nr:mitotic checkpoint serine/threonine-protein kinase BUB1 beta isoform D [Patagioenas fasciata monilis]